MTSLTAPAPLRSTKLIADLCDSGSFSPLSLTIEHPMAPHGASEAVSTELERARQATGLNEALQCGLATVLGEPVVLVVLEFSFIGGTIGVAAANIMVQAVQRATAERLPLIICTASGGTRVTEGTRAFAAMLAITAAIEAHKASGLLYISYLCNPTLGGAFASWASQGQLLIAEPGARIGFLGPKVHAALSEQDMPEGTQTAENVLLRGGVDLVATAEDAQGVIHRLIQTVGPAEQREAHTSGYDLTLPSTRALPAWHTVQLSRDPARASASELISSAWETNFFFDGGSTCPNPVRLALARTSQGPVMVIAQEVRTPIARAQLRAADFRLARRGIELAGQFGLPIVTMIDTPGAESSAAAENETIAREIALTLGALAAHPHPVVSAIIGQGTGGGAIALLPADFTIGFEHAWLAPLPPEGVNAIMRGNEATIGEAADLQGLDSASLLDAQIIDVLVPEDRNAENVVVAHEFARVAAQSLHRLSSKPPEQLLRQRHERFLRYAC